MGAPTTFRDVLARFAAGEREFAWGDLGDDPDCYLAGVRLDGADFSHSTVVVGFCGASLGNSRLVEANVKTCDFRGAAPTGADFSGAALCSTEFAGAILEGTRFAGAYFLPRFRRYHRDRCVQPQCEPPPLAKRVRSRVRRRPATNHRA